MNPTHCSPCRATAVSSRGLPLPGSPAACPAVPPAQAEHAPVWSVVEVCTWPAVAQAAACAAPAAPVAPTAPDTAAAVWPPKRRWPDVDDLGPVEWLQASQPLSPSALRGSH